jgi:hypothetical protein
MVGKQQFIKAPDFLGLHCSVVPHWHLARQHPIRKANLEGSGLSGMDRLSSPSWPLRSRSPVHRADKGREAKIFLKGGCLHLGCGMRPCTATAESSTVF